jgi:branched-chain amino acid transport system ATP-binding protein
VDSISEFDHRAMEVLESVGLAEHRDSIAGNLSHGDQKRLEIAVTLTSDPKLLLLDEPTAGMNPDETRYITDLVSRVARERGMTVIFCEHDMSIVFSIAQRIIVLHQGSVLADGDPDAIRCNQEVRTAYLGSEEMACSR